MYYVHNTWDKKKIQLHRGDFYESFTVNIEY